MINSRFKGKLWHSGIYPYLLSFSCTANSCWLLLHMYHTSSRMLWMWSSKKETKSEFVIPKCWTIPLGRVCSHSVVQARIEWDYFISLWFPSLSGHVVCYILLHAWLWVDTSARLCPDLFGMRPPLQQPGPLFPALTQTWSPEIAPLHLSTYLVVCFEAGV